MQTENLLVHVPTESEVREQFRAIIGEGYFFRWFNDVQWQVDAVEGSPATLRLAFPSAFLCQWARTNYWDVLCSVWQQRLRQGNIVCTVLPPRPPEPLVYQLPLFPEETRPVSNDMARSALFSCVQGKDRQMLEKTLLATVDGVEIRFTGRQFNQDDHDVLMQLVFMARHKPLGDTVTIPANAILKSLGRGSSGKEYLQLHDEIERLVSGTISLRNIKRRTEYIGHLIDKAVQEETSRYWMYAFNPDLRILYSPEAYTLLEWKQRIGLRGQDLARWLQLYLVGHAKPFPVKVETLRELSGSRMKAVRDFRRQLRLVLARLEANKDIVAWAIDANDLVTVERVPSPSQARHLVGKLTGNSRNKIRE